MGTSLEHREYWQENLMLSGVLCFAHGRKEATEKKVILLSYLRVLNLLDNEALLILIFWCMSK